VKLEGTFEAPEAINRWQTVALGVGGIGVAVLIAVIAFFPEQREEALRGWLLGFIFWAGIGFGGLGILLLQYLTGGAWGVVIRRLSEASTRTIPILAILFIPIVVGVYQLYEWANLHAAGTDKIMNHRGWYLDPQWWTARAALYFIILFCIAYFLNKWSLKQDSAETPEEAAGYLGAATKLAAPGIIIYVLVVTFLSVDWVMTLEPHWFSTMFGFLFVAGWALSCFSFAVCILAFLSDKAPMDRVLGKRHFHDIGKLMLAFVMVWAYFNFSQYLIIWSGNLTEETPFYVIRSKGMWGAIGLILIIFHFAFPFLVLLMQDFKRKAKLLALLAGFILVMRLVDMYYIIGPSPKVGDLSKHLMEVPFTFTVWDIVAPIAIGGIWLWWFFRELKARPLVPIKDPFLENAVKHGKGH